MPNDPQTRANIAAHEEWLGFVQPVGLVVAPPVLVVCGVIIDRNVRPRQERLDALLNDDETCVTDIRSIFVELLGWEEDDLVDAAPEQQIRLPELDVTLEPHWRVKDRDGATQLLIRCEAPGTDLDDAPANPIDGWTASPQIRFERLLRETGIPTGLLCTPEAVRLVHAPAGETSGHITFRIKDMAQVMGRPILAAFDLLLGEYRMFRAEAGERLASLLAESRTVQNNVSTRLARQVLGALHELLRGFVATDALRRDSTAPIARLAAEDPQRLYAGLVTVLMRLVFVLYAEDRDLMPVDANYEQKYGLRGLFKKLRDDAARHGHDLMDRRYGAWARLFSLFRLIHGGGGRDGFRFVARKGRLFDPDRFPFLEGRGKVEEAPGTLPLLSDGTIWRVLERLLVLDGERLSYRTLDVEEIGSVYQAVMGFRIEHRSGRSLVLRSKGHHGAGVIVDIDALLTIKPSERKKRLSELEVAALTAKEEKAVAGAGTIEGLADALSGKIDEDATPTLAPVGQPLLQATDERRRSGSHYTPRSLTQPIVAETLRPILEKLGPRATPDQILSLKVLDPAMGSGAFLVEACRQLADALVKAWEAHDVRPEVPADEDALLYAKRLVVQRCLYGVDRNELAAELGKLSLWLATLAREHEFTFLDHCIRHGDSLVGLDRRQIEALSWMPETSEAPLDLLHVLVRDRLAEIERERDRIRTALDDASEDQQRFVLACAERSLADPKMIGDAVIAAFFSADKARAREEARLRVREEVEQEGIGWQDRLRPDVVALRNGMPAVVPFHWPLEFPEVFDRDNPGFDAIVGNPPFAGKNTTIAVNADHYLDWLQTLHPGAHGNSDLIAHFFRRAFLLLRKNGCTGLIATNSIAQGDTRSTGLRFICTHDGIVYTARKRIRWPGEAAVVVSTVHFQRDGLSNGAYLDGSVVERISAYLLPGILDDAPDRLTENENVAFKGGVIMGDGFIFSDPPKENGAGRTDLARQLLSSSAKNRVVLIPYIAGGELNDMPEPRARRFIISFAEFSEQEARQWPELMKIVEEKVKPERMTLRGNRDADIRRKYWWRWGRFTPALYRQASSLSRVLVCANTGLHKAFVFLPSATAFDQTLIVFCVEEWSAFTAIQCRVHGVWNAFQGSSLEDRLRYTPSDCFETYPFPDNWKTRTSFEAVGKAYYEFRAALMREYDKGLTEVYNRFHDPDERSNAIGELRRLHDAMDRAVLDAYGWTDIRPRCEFELEWEDDEAENGRRRRKPWRYRWPEPVRDEVLARLLALNAQRAEEERLVLGDR